MVLGEVGRKQTFGFIRLIEPKVSMFPPTRTETVLVFSPATIIDWRLRRAVCTSTLLPTTNVVSVEQAFCVLFVEFVVDNILAVFNGVCCGDGANVAATFEKGLGRFQQVAPA